MRLFSSAPWFYALGALAFGCTVYSNDLLSSNGGLTGTSGTKANDNGGTTSNGGSEPDAGKTSTSGSAGTATGGTDAMTDGGADGEAGEATTGGGGSAGTAGGASAGAGGTAGAASGGAAGSAGAGGMVPVSKCGEHPIPIKPMWTPTASTSSVGNGTESDGLFNPPFHLSDGNTAERWSSGKTQSGDEWIQIDFGAVTNFDQVTLQVFGNDVNDYPRGWAVRVSNTTNNFNAVAVASGTGAFGSTVIDLPTMATGRFLLIRQTGVVAAPATSWWTVAEVAVACLH